MQGGTLTRAISNRTLLRWVWLVLIALAELAWLSIRIEAPSTGLLYYTKGFPSIFIISLAITTILGWVAARGKILKLPIFRDCFHQHWWMVLPQLGAFVVFAWLTILVFEGYLESSHFPALWILGWVATGFAAGAFWIIAAIPARECIRLVRENWLVVLAGIVIIAASWVLGFLGIRAWKSLQSPTFVVVEWLLRIFGQDVVSQPAHFVLGTKQFNVSIHFACSGYEGIALMILFVGSYLWLFRSRLRFPQAFILLPFATTVIWLVNAVRIASLVMVGTHVSPQIAMGGFHSQTGWIGFIAVALGLVAMTQRMPFFAVTQSAIKAQGIDPTAAFLAPLMVLLAVTIVSGVFSSGFDLLYPAV